MIALPAIDLREGACVQLVGGSYAQERVRLRDPLAVAQHWRHLGFRGLHVVDLDAATDRGSNADLVGHLLGTSGADVQVGGGIRSAAGVCALLAAGAHRIVVGTRALEDPQWLVDITTRASGRVVVAVDVRDGRPVVRGWSRPIPRTLRSLLTEMDTLPIAGILVTAVDVEGALKGPDLRLTQEVLDLTSLPVIAAGGITTLDDLRALDRIGVTAAVVGMALYTGDMNAAQCAGEFG